MRRAGQAHRGAASRSSRASRCAGAADVAWACATAARAATILSTAAGSIVIRVPAHSARRSVLSRSTTWSRRSCSKPSRPTGSPSPSPRSNRSRRRLSSLSDNGACGVNARATRPSGHAVNTMRSSPRIVLWHALERVWEEKLRALEAVEQDHARWQREELLDLNDTDRLALQHLGENLPRVWNAATTSAAERKRLLRFVVREVVLDQKRTRGQVWLKLV